MFHPRIGCAYFHVTGGAAQYLAQCIRDVQGVYFFDEFGQPEAMWKLRVQDLPALVIMDTHGYSLHDAIEEETALNLKKLLSPFLEEAPGS